MSLPPFKANDDLPEGVHKASWAEVLDRFNGGTKQRRLVARSLMRLYELALGSGYLDRMIIFGSFITAKRNPNDVDVILIMKEDFVPSEVSPDASVLFDHQRADEELGASIFWLRPSMLLGESMESFVAGWQLKRNGGKRGIVEVAGD